MKHHDTVKKIVLFSMCVLLAGAAALCGALPSLTVTPQAAKQTTNAAIQQKEKEIQLLESRLSSVEKEIKNAKTQISNATDALEQEQEHKKLLDEQLALVAESIAATEDLIVTYEQQIAGKEDEIRQKEDEIAAQYKTVGEWMRLSYEMSDANYLQMILSSKSFAAFLDSVEMYTSMMSYQDGVMRNLQAELIALKQEKDALDIFRAELSATEGKLSTQKTYYETLIKNSLAYSASLQQKIQSYKNDVSDSQSEQKKLLASREQLNAELKEELRKLAQQNAVYVGGKYIWPVNAQKYKRISSPFGWRDLYGVKNLHTGIDIPCDYGADVWASNAGTVVKATWHYSYGYYVVVDHGGGQTTLYAHNSRLLVKQGDRVTQGQVIAKAGATGNAYGNHLHFEVRINGEAVNPMKGYLTQP